MVIRSAPMPYVIIFFQLSDQQNHEFMRGMNTALGNIINSAQIRIEVEEINCCNNSFNRFANQIWLCFIAFSNKWLRDPNAGRGVNSTERGVKTVSSLAAEAVSKLNCAGTPSSLTNASCSSCDKTSSSDLSSLKTSPVALVSRRLASPKVAIRIPTVSCAKSTPTTKR